MRTCRECGRDENDDLEFKENANICIPCHKKYMEAYRKANRWKLSRQVQEWRDANRERHREASRRRYRTPEGKAKHQARVERHRKLSEASEGDASNFNRQENDHVDIERTDRTCEQHTSADQR